tara:strand:+ start:422 stop:1030 length:609 start_codon:yes stop_codon:yes gene_type:complete
MGSSCCDKKSEDLKDLAKSQSRVLWIILVINLVMFFVEFGFGLMSHSQALMADSLDMLGDALAYASSLYVVSLGMRAKAKASIFKASLMLVTGLAVLAKSIHTFISPELPLYETMSIVAIVALAMNSLCLFLLTRHKNDDINFRSVWICSRNDIIANTSVIAASFFVFYFASPWPDLIVAIGITILFMRSSWFVFSEARSQL